MSEQTATVGSPLRQGIRAALVIVVMRSAAAAAAAPAAATGRVAGVTRTIPLASTEPPMQAGQTIASEAANESDARSRRTSARRSRRNTAGCRCQATLMSADSWCFSRGHRPSLSAARMRPRKREGTRKRPGARGHRYLASRGRRAATDLRGPKDSACDSAPTRFR
jgi:hypothetical protein